jgi:hypothetical protein
MSWTTSTCCRNLLRLIPIYYNKYNGIGKGMGKKFQEDHNIINNQIVVLVAPDNQHTFFFPVLHTLDHEVGIALCLGQDGYH